jgi:DNA-binding MarR family transcriptional regulator
LTAVPSALEHHLGFWLRFASNHVSRRFESLLGEHGISVTEWVAVRTLYGQSNSTHASLTGGLSMTKGAVSKVVTKLENKGFVDRSFAKTRTIGSFSDTWTAESETN